MTLLEEMREARRVRRLEVLSLSPEMLEDFEMLTALALWRGDITHSRAGELLGIQNVLRVRELMARWADRIQEDYS